MTIITVRMCCPVLQDVCSNVGCVQELDGEAGWVSLRAHEETAGTYKRSTEVCGRAGQSTQKGKKLYI